MTEKLLREAEAKIANQREEINHLRKTLDALSGPSRRPEVSPAHEALRMAGFFRLPRWYVTQDQFDVVERMADGNKEEVWRIKKGVA